MTNKETRRRASQYRHHAEQLKNRAAGVRDAADRRHMLDLAAMYERTANQMAPQTQTETELIFRPR